MTRPADENNRRRVREDWHRNMVVEAGAGTGKTSLLIDRAIGALAAGRVHVRGLVMITYMEKAAQELRERLHERLQEEVRHADPVLRTRFESAMDAMPTASITTLHGLGYRILRRYPLEAGIAPNAEVWDGVEAERQRKRAFDLWVRGAPSLWRRRLETVGEFGVAYPQWQQLIFQGAQLTRAKIPARTRSSSPEELLPQWTATLENLHTKILQVRPHPDDQGVGQVKTLLATFSLLGRLPVSSWAPRLYAMTIPAPKGNQKNWASDPHALKTQKQELNRIREELSTWQQDMAGALVSDLAEMARDFEKFFQAWRDQHQAIIFEDQIQRALSLLRSQPEIRQTIASEIQMLMVDEFQDTDPDQVEMVQWLAADPTMADPDLDRPPLGRLVIVGDAKQSIYRFRGADVKNAEGWARRLIAGGFADEVPITVNFRCDPAIIDTVNTTFQTLMDATSPYDPMYRAIEAYRPAGLGRRVWRWVFETAAVEADDRRKQEAEAVASLIMTAIREHWPSGDRHGNSHPLTFRDVAILMPHRTGLEIYQRALEDGGIPIQAGGTRGFYQRDDIRGLAAILRAAALPEDEVAVLAALRSVWWSLPDRELWRHKVLGGTWHPLEPQPPSAVAERLERLAMLHHKWPALSAEGVIDAVIQERVSDLNDAEWANVRKLMEQAQRYGRRWGYGEYTGWLWERIVGGVQEEEAEPPSGQDGVRLSTIHQAKGLEWPMVVVTNLDRQNHAPGLIAIDPERKMAAARMGAHKTANWTEVTKELARADEAEERRLWYVALTRARDYLTIVQAGPESIFAPFIPAVVPVSQGLPSPLDVVSTDGGHLMPPVQLKLEEPTIRPSGSIEIGSGDPVSRQRGRQFHRWIERVLSREVVMADVPAAFAEALQWVADRPWLQHRRWWTEVPVDWSGPPEVHGIVDLVVEGSEGLWIVDFKTDPIVAVDNDGARYLPQLTWYAKALQAAPGLQVAGIRLVWPMARCEWERTRGDWQEPDV